MDKLKKRTLFLSLWIFMIKMKQEYEEHQLPENYKISVCRKLRNQDSSDYFLRCFSEGTNDSKRLILNLPKNISGKIRMLSTAILRITFVLFVLR